MHFFEELQRLRERTLVPAILTVRSENCDYCPYHASGKNSYLVIGHNLCEDCLYGFWVGLSRDCVDCAFVEKCELCYECVDCRECFNCTFCQDSSGCSDCTWCYDCRGCQNCFGCVDLRHKQYHIFNQPYSKEEYFEKIAALTKAYPQKPPAQFLELQRTLPHIAMHSLNNENVVGDHIYNSWNAYYCFDVSDQEDTMYMYNAFRTKDTMDCSYTGQSSELNYMCHSATTLFNSNFCNICWFSQNLEYCEYVFNSHDCFGCVSRNHAEYEILNKKYPKEEYFKKVTEIKEELKRDGTYGRWWWPSPYEEVQPFPSYMA